MTGVSWDVIKTLITLLAQTERIIWCQRWTIKPAESSSVLCFFVSCHLKYKSGDILCFSSSSDEQWMCLRSSLRVCVYSPTFWSSVPQRQVWEQPWLGRNLLLWSVRGAQDGGCSNAHIWNFKMHDDGTGFHVCSWNDPLSNARRLQKAS